MRNSKIKIFHGLVNYGTQAGMLAKGLRDEGYEALSVCYHDKSKRIIDIEIPKTKTKTIIGKVKLLYKKLSWFFKYDVFHFYYGKTLLPFNLDLYFYKLFRKKVFMEYLGHDVDLCLGMNGLDYRNRVCNRRDKIRMIDHQAKYVNKQLVCAPYYYQFVNNSIIVPLAIDLEMYSYSPLKLNEDYLTIMHCPTDRTYKKSDVIEEAIDKLISEGYKIVYNCITHVTHDQLKKEYLKADIVIDQLNPWYGTVSIEAMALGRPVISGFYRHLLFYDYENFKDLPIINADVHNVYDVIKDVMEKKYDLEALSLKSRKFVEKVHNLKKVTSQVLEIYDKY